MSEVFRYIEKDFEEMNLNEYAWHLKDPESRANIKEYLKKAYAYTLFDKVSLAIVAFEEIKPDMYDCFIIAGKEFGNSPKYAVKMKWLCWKMINEFGMKRIETVSEDEEKLNKWHRFIGFRETRKLPNYYKGRDYLKWIIKTV